MYIKPLFILIVFCFSNQIKSYSQEPEIKSYATEGPRKTYPLSFSEDKVRFKPFGLSDRFDPKIEPERLFWDFNSQTDEEKDSSLRMVYGRIAEQNFLYTLADWLIPVLTLGLFIAFISGNYIKSSVKKSSASSSTGLTKLGVSLVIALTGLYLLFGKYKGNNEDFKLFVSTTWTLQLGITLGYLLIVMLFTKLHLSMKKLENIQKLILLIGISIGAIMLTNYMNTLSGRYYTMFQLEDYGLNWTCCSFIILLSAYSLLKNMREKDDIPPNDIGIN